MAFATLVFCELTRAFAIRSETWSIFKIGVFSNKSMNAAFAISLLLQLSVLFIPPIQKIFHVVNLTGIEWLIVIGLSLIPLIISEFVKALKK
jgi:Ca2+-transporting ATPase